MTCPARLCFTDRPESRRQDHMPETHFAPVFAPVAAESSRAHHMPRTQHRARIRPSLYRRQASAAHPMTHFHALFDTVRAETRRQEHMP
jgi:hypothetical protein